MWALQTCPPPHLPYEREESLGPHFWSSFVPWLELASLWLSGHIASCKIPRDNKSAQKLLYIWFDKKRRGGAHFLVGESGFCWLVRKLCFCPMMLLIHFRQPFSLAKKWSGSVRVQSSNCHLIAWHVQATFKIAWIPTMKPFPLKTGLKSVLGGSHFFFLFSTVGSRVSFKKILWCSQDGNHPEIL